MVHSQRDFQLLLFCYWQVFVIAPHANQMLDPLVVIETCGRSEDIGVCVCAWTCTYALCLFFYHAPVYAHLFDRDSVYTSACGSSCAVLTP